MELNGFIRSFFIGGIIWVVEEKVNTESSTSAATKSDTSVAPAADGEEKASDEGQKEESAEEENQQTKSRWRRGKSN